MLLLFPISLVYKNYRTAREKSGSRTVTTNYRPKSFMSKFAKDSHVSICEAWGDMGPVSPVHRDAPSVGAVTLASSSSCTIWRLGLVDNTKQNQLARSKTRVAVVDYSLARARAHRAIPATIHRLQHNQGSRVREVTGSSGLEASVWCRGSGHGDKKVYLNFSECGFNTTRVLANC